MREGRQTHSYRVRSLKPPHSRSAIGIGAVKKTENLVVAIWKYRTTYGHTDMVISNLGNDLYSKLFADLVKLMGMRHAS